MATLARGNIEKVYEEVMSLNEAHPMEKNVMDALFELLDEEYLYGYYFNIAGYFKIMLLWSEENPRRAAKEMSEIATRILLRER